LGDANPMRCGSGDKKKVFISTGESACDDCGWKLGRHAWINPAGERTNVWYNPIVLERLNRPHDWADQREPVTQRNRDRRSPEGHARKT
jgi:hypothetical protein